MGEFLKDIQETDNSLSNIELFNKIRIYVWTSFGIIFFLLKITNQYNSPWFVIMGLLSMTIINYVLNNFTHKKKTEIGTGKMVNIYFIFQVLEAIFILVLMHVAGVTPFLGAIILANYLFTAYFTYNNKFYLWGVLSFCLSGYITLVSLEYFGVIPFVDVLGTGINLSGNFSVFMINLVPSTLLMVLLFIIISFFSDKLHEIIKELFQKEKELSEAKGVLEIRVKARTQELEREKISLEQKVRERTVELQNKINELEKFQKISVGRELKMIELKKEVDRLNGGA